MEQNTQNNDLIVTKPFHLPENVNEKIRIYKHRGEIRGGKEKRKKKVLLGEEKTPENENEQQDFCVG